MNAPTNARAHLPGECPECRDNGFISGQACPRCTHPLSPAGLASIGVAINRDALCLPLLTDAQALATWERMKAVRKAYVAAVLSEIAE